MKRKTMSIDFIKDEANAKLAVSGDADIEYRRGVIALLKPILFAAHNYSGFRYLTIDEINGTVPGINCISPDIKKKIDEDTLKKMHFTDTDSTRVHYL
jgi:hypothetical protein